MEKFAHELEFISQIKRDGSSVTKVKKSYLKAMNENELMKKETFYLKCLSTTEQTYIAFNFNAFVVRIKDVCNRINNPDNNRCIVCGAKAGHECELKKK